MPRLPGRNARCRSCVFVDGQGLIGGVSTNPIPASPTTWDGVDSMLRSVAPQVRLLVAEVTDGSCRPLHAIDPTTTAPVGSVLKLYVLAALGTAVKSGTVSWTQQLTVTPELKSLPSGVLQDRPDGTRVSVQDVATGMISISDNTATDMLIHQLGRPAVEAELHAAGMVDPSRNEPFLSTRETFILALRAMADSGRALHRRRPGGPPDAAGHRRGPGAATQPEAAQALTSRRASRRDRLVRLGRGHLPRLHPARRPGRAARAGADRRRAASQRWRAATGPDPVAAHLVQGRGRSGLLAAAYLATTQTGHSYVVAAVAENPSQPIPEGADLSMLAAIRGAFTLAAQS